MQISQPNYVYGDLTCFSFSLILFFIFLDHYIYILVFRHSLEKMCKFVHFDNTSMDYCRIYSLISVISN